LVNNALNLSQEGERMDDKQEMKRSLAIERFLAGESPEVIWRTLRRSERWFFKWLARYRTGEEHWYKEQSRRPHGFPARTIRKVEEAVEFVRGELWEAGEFCGAQVINWRLEELGVKPLPSTRTIGRILARHGLICRRKGRYQPKGTPYPRLAAKRPNDVHQTDFVGPRHLRGGLRFYSLHSVDMVTGRCGVQPVVGGRSLVVGALWAIWRRLGLPRYQQVDNESCFYGSQACPRGMGKLIRLCLMYAVEPVFIPLQEPWRNGVAEKFNCHWQQKFLGRVKLATQEDLYRESLAFEGRHNRRWRYSKLKGKTPLEALAAADVKLRFPPTSEPPAEPLPKPKRGRYHVVRLIRSDAVLNLFGERFAVPREAVYEYVRATVDVRRQRLLLYMGAELIDDRAYPTR